MNRLALRLSATAALLGGGSPATGESWPTLAGGSVYDSRQDDISTEEGLAGIVILRTDLDKRTLAQRSGGTRDIDVQVQIGVQSSVKVLDEGGNPVKGTDGSFQIRTNWATTEASLEAFLDLLEWQVESALFGGGVWANWFQSLWTPGEMSSQPLFLETNEGKVRVAARMITFPMDQFPVDDLAPMLRVDDPPYTPVLPQRLRDVFDRIDRDGGGDFKIACGQIRAQLEAQALPAAGRYPPLHRVHGSLFMSKVAPPTGQEEQPSVIAELLT